MRCLSYEICLTKNCPSRYKFLPRHRRNVLDVARLLPPSYLVDGVEDVLREPADVAGPRLLRPLLVLGMVELVAPQSPHQFSLLDLELVSVDLGELLEGERPAVQARAEPDRPLSRVHHDLTHRPFVVSVRADQYKT